MPRAFAEMTYLYRNDWVCIPDVHGTNGGHWRSKDNVYAVRIQPSGMFACFTVKDGENFYDASSFELARHAVFGFDCAEKALAIKV